MEYFTNQRHGSLKDYLVHYLSEETSDNDGSLVQVSKDLFDAATVRKEHAPN